MTFGKAEKRDPKTFYFDGGLKVKPLLRELKIEETAKSVSVGEFELELPNTDFEIEFVFAESAGLAKDFQDDPQAALKDLCSFRFSQEKPDKAKRKLVVSFSPWSDGKVDGSLFSAPEWQLVLSYRGTSITSVLKNPFLGYNSAQIYMCPVPNSPGLKDGSVPHQRNNAIGLMRTFKTKMPDDKTVTYKDIFLKFSVVSEKKS